MSDENKALIRRWFEEVWNQGREEVIDELFAADGIAHGLADAEQAGDHCQRKVEQARREHPAGVHGIECVRFGYGLTCCSGNR